MSSETLEIFAQGTWLTRNNHQQFELGSKEAKSVTFTRTYLALFLLLTILGYFLHVSLDISRRVLIQNFQSPDEMASLHLHHYTASVFTLCLELCLFLGLLLESFLVAHLQWKKREMSIWIVCTSPKLYERSSSRKT